MTQGALRLAQWSVGTGIVLAISKVGLGWYTHSFSLVADGIESAGDVVASMILWLGLRIAAEPADENHPYGHGRVEILAGQAIGAFLIASGVLLGRQAIEQMGEAKEAPHALAVAPLVVSIAVKLLLVRKKRKAAWEFRSAAMEADAANDWLDVLSGTIALVALGMNIAVPGAFGQADRIGGLLIAGLVVYLGFGVLRQSSWELLDTMPPAGMLEEIRRAALGVDGTLGVEKCRARKTGFQYHVDLHLEVAPELSVREAHEISGAVRAAVKQRVNWVADVLVHIEPAPRGE
ncbi:MAG: cation diffusion facilitator family transporter [Bryobacter sp.]|jgi:cation diffusion facilitator family transporter|nr:cation diffusion facilitator family transporter [Bryobacter sp. CoA8 C33]